MFFHEVHAAAESCFERVLQLEVVGEVVGDGGGVEVHEEIDVTVVVEAGSEHGTEGIEVANPVLAAEGCDVVAGAFEDITLHRSVGCLGIVFPPQRYKLFLIRRAFGQGILLRGGKKGEEGGFVRGLVLPGDALRREEDGAVALEGCGGPVVGDEAPVVAGAGTDAAFLTDALDEVVAQVVVGAGDDSRREFGEGDACSAGEELAASVAAIAVGGHEVFAVEVEGAPVLHGEDGDLLPVGLGGVHGVADACCGVEVEGHVLQAESAAAVEHAVEEEDVVVGRVHGGGPEVVAHLEESEYLAACEAHGVEEVLVLVEGEHVGDVCHACGDGGVEGEGCREGYFCSLTDFELEVVDEVYEG